MKKQTRNKTKSQPKPKDELLVTFRLCRNGAHGYIVNFYKGGKHVAWHHCKTRHFVEPGKLVYNFLCCSMNIPIEDSINFTEASITTNCKCGCHE